MFQEFVNAYGMEIIGLVLTTIFGLLGMVIRRLATNWLDTQEKQNVAKVAVRFVEQVFHELHGPEKLDKALETASALLAEKKIDFSVNEMKIIIEAAVEEMNEMIKPPLLLEAEPYDLNSAMGIGKVTEPDPDTE